MFIYNISFYTLCAVDQHIGHFFDPGSIKIGYELTDVSINLGDQGTPKPPNINPNPSAHFHSSHSNSRLRKGVYQTKPFFSKKQQPYSRSRA